MGVIPWLIVRPTPRDARRPPSAMAAPQSTIADRPPIDEPIDTAQSAPVAVGARDEAPQCRPTLLVLHGDERRRVVLAHDRRDAVQGIVCGRPHDRGPVDRPLGGWYGHRGKNGRHR